MNLSDDFIQDLKDRNDISEVISEYVRITRRGRNMMGLCPFHSEKTASFVVYPGNESFYCFGCGVGGDVITFVRLIEDLDYVEAVRLLAKRANMPLPEANKDDDTYKKKMLIYEINRETARFYHSCINKEIYKNALQYLKNRGLSSSTIIKFGLGYAPGSGYALFDHLKSRGYESQDMVLSNVVSKGKSGYYDRFRDRVMFPIIDLRGNVIAFGGRTMGKGEPKYLNSSDTLVFKKSNNLFALNFAKNKIEKKLILAEGYMDVIALHQAGFENTVATLGTSLTEQQVKLMSRYAEEVVVAYDSDEAGRKASDRAIKMLRNDGLVARVLYVPSGKDPDEFIKKYGPDGKLRFKELVDNSLSDVEFKLQRLKVGYDLDKPADKVKYLSKCIKVLAEISNSIECQVYAGKLSEELGVDRKLILSQTEALKKKESKKRNVKFFKEVQRNISGFQTKFDNGKSTSLRASGAERALISCIINNRDTANNIFSRVSPDMFINKLHRKIYVAIQNLFNSQRPIDVTTLSSQDFSLAETGYITKLACDYIPPQDIEKDIGEYIDIMKQENSIAQIQGVDNIEEFQVQQYIRELKNIKK